MREKIISLIKLLMNLDSKYYIVKMISIFLFIYLIYCNYINPYLLIRSLTVLLFLMVYKWMLIHLGNDHYIGHLSLKTRAKMFRFVDIYIIKERLYIIKIFYYILYYFPTNWFYLIVIVLAKKYGNLRLWVNSTKDVVGKKYFNKNWSYISLQSLFKAEWFKKYIIDILFRVLYLPVYFKINLIALEWKKFFEYRFFGIVYASVLIAYNLHPTIWFKNTDLIQSNIKIIITIFICYFFLFYLYSLVSTKLGDPIINYAKFKWDIENKQLTKEYWYNNTCKKSLINLKTIVHNPQMSMYYKVQDYLVFMSLANYFELQINGRYSIFLITTENIFNKSLPSNLIRINRITSDRLEDSYFYEQYISQFNNKCFYEYIYKKDKNVVTKIRQIDIAHNIWTFEKNYRVSMCLYLMINYEEKWAFLNNKLFDYELYKTLYGSEIIEKTFEFELVQLEDYIFILGLINYLFENYFNAHELLKQTLYKQEYEIPLTLQSNTNYNKIAKVCNFLVYDIYCKLMFLDYFTYFDANVAFHTRIIYSDTLKYKKQYKTIDEFKKNWKGVNNKLENIWMQMRIEIFSNHTVNVENRQLILRKKIDNFIKQNIELKNLQIHDIINLIECLQNEFHMRYNNNLTKLTSPDFLEKNQVLEKWEYFGKINKKMLF